MPEALHLTAAEFRTLLERLGPSLALWRAAEIAALRTVTYEPPVLDLGCGDGVVTSFLLRHVDIGVDPAPDALRRASRLGLYRRLEPVPVEDAPIAPASVATVVSNSVLEHVSDLPAVLCAVARVLGARGHLVFTVPTEAFSDWLFLPAARYAAWRNAHYEHRNLWPIDRWAHYLRQAGLAIVSVRPYLRRELVAAWDGLDLLQQPRLGRRSLFGLWWRRLPPASFAWLARRLARIDLSAPEPGGGRLIVARKA